MRLTGAAEAIRDQIGSPMGVSWRELFASLVTEPAMAAAGEAAAAARMAGASMSITEAIEYALDGGGPHP
jgi:hypothetical protein